MFKRILDLGGLACGVGFTLKLLTSSVSTNASWTNCFSNLWEDMVLTVSCRGNVLQNSASTEILRKYYLQGGVCTFWHDKFARSLTWDQLNEDLRKIGNGQAMQSSRRSSLGNREGCGGGEGCHLGTTHPARVQL